MKPEEFYEKEFGNAEYIPKESVIRLLDYFAFAREKANKEEAIKFCDWYLTEFHQITGSFADGGDENGQIPDTRTINIVWDEYKKQQYETLKIQREENRLRGK